MADSISIDQRADVVRTAFAGFGAEDPDAIAAAFHPEGELVLHGGLALLTGASHRGRTAVRAWFEDWFETMELTAAGVEHMAPVGDRMLMVATQRSRSASVGAPAATRFAVICSFDEGLIARFELYQDPDEALPAPSTNRSQVIRCTGLVLVFVLRPSSAWSCTTYRTS